MENQPMQGGMPAKSSMGMKKKGNPFSGIMPMAIMAFAIVAFLLLVFLAVKF